MHFYKRLYLVGFIAYAVALLLSLLFYEERTAFGDIAFHLFEIIRKDGFAIQTNRFGAVVTQIFPVVGVKAGLSLTAIMKLYSCGFAIFYLACYATCGLILKQYKWGLVLLLTQTLFVAHTFYWIQSELPQGLALVCLFFALIEAYGDTIWVYVPGAVLLCTIACIHPLMPIVFMYAVAFFWLTNRMSFGRAFLLFVTLAEILFIKTLFFRNRYDVGSMGSIKNFKKLFPNYVDLWANHQFLRYCLTHYYFIPLTFFIIIFSYAKRKEWKILAFCAASVLAYFTLIQVCYPGTDTYDCYRENLYLILGFLIAVPLVWDVLPLQKARRILIPATVVVIIAYSARLLYTYPVYHHRLQLLSSFIDKHRDQKVIAQLKLAGMEHEPFTWATPYETWLLSTSRYYTTASIMLTERPDRYQWMLGRPDIFITPWIYLPYKEMPVKYFVFRDTLTAYQILK